MITSEPITLFIVTYGSHNINKEWVLGTYDNLDDAFAHFDRLSAIRQPGEYVVISSRRA